MSGCAVWTAAAVSGVRQRRGTAAGCPDGTVHRGQCRSLRVSLLHEPVAWPASAGGMQPPPVRLAKLAGQPCVELLAHVGHSRPLQRHRLLTRQPTKLEAVEVAAAPGGDHRAGGRLQVDADLGPGVGGPGAQLHRQVGHEHQLVGGPVRGGRSAAHTAACRPAAPQPDAAAPRGRPPARPPPRRRPVRGAGRGSSPAPDRAPGPRRARWRQARHWTHHRQRQAAAGPRTVGSSSPPTNRRTISVGRAALAAATGTA
jgi:hypothetical protein